MGLSSSGRTAGSQPVNTSSILVSPTKGVVVEKTSVPSSGDPAGYDGGITIPGILAVMLLVVIGFIWAFVK